MGGVQININKVEIDKMKSMIREAQTLIHTDQRLCSSILEDVVWELGEIETKHYRTLKKVADKGLK